MAIRSTLPPIDFIRMRRSVMAANITEPGPTPEELNIIIEAGLRVPDHSRCGPWRVQIIGKIRAVTQQVPVAYSRLLFFP